MALKCHKTFMLGCFVSFLSRIGGGGGLHIHALASRFLKAEVIEFRCSPKVPVAS